MTAKTRTTARTLTTTALALLMGLIAIAAKADPPVLETRNQHQQNDRRYDNRHDNRRYDNRHYDNRRYNPPGHVRQNYPRGAGPDYRWHQGDRIPPQYRGRGYVVDDWRGHRLSSPPRGYHWVQYGSDYLLVAIATGVIASLILNN